MSKYTTELRFICESLVPEVSPEYLRGYEDVSSIIEAARPKIFSFPYPIFDEEYKPVLETKFIKHFYTREIGLETYGLWKLRLDEKMNMVMPYFNNLYEAARLKFNPLHDVDLFRTFDRRANDEGTRNTNNQNNSHTATNINALNKILDTPQNGVDDLLSGKYLTEASHNTADNTVTGNGSFTGAENTIANTTENYVEHVSGKQGSGSFSKMMKEYMEYLKNVDAMFLEEMSDLFMKVY